MVVKGQRGQNGEVAWRGGNTVDMGLGFGSALGFSGWKRDGKRVMI